MNFKDRQVVVTGGTGALGIAVVGALLQAGAVCHIPYRSEDEAKRFPHREQKGVSLVALRDLADEDRSGARLAVDERLGRLVVGGDRHLDVAL